ncbi:MAG: alcohol dehydrogenase catalytic domain-containing protein, partial [Bacteroidales bacterium]|nr:alcohol dehydrogenase catalytic domain-containing protein [Bacteroidales bacterium]
MAKNTEHMMKALFQDEPRGKLFYREVDIPVPGKGEVLVKMEASPINFSDLSLLQGTFSTKPQYPVIPGIEGSGRVISSGGGLIARMRVGKRVACTTTAGRGGTWADYMVTSATNCIPLNSKINSEQGSMLIVNPMTALALIDIAKRGKHKAIVNNAAASALGRMLVRLSNRYGIPLINIVRREEQIIILKGEGAKIIINSNDPDYEQSLGELTHKHHATLILDAIGGSQTETLVKTAPDNSTIILYAKLSEEPISLDSRLIVQSNKKIKGFL